MGLKVEWKLVPDDVRLEEETRPDYDPEQWYPVCVGAMLGTRYQSFVWLCRDSLYGQFENVMSELKMERELSASEKIRVKSIPGKETLSTVLNQFDIIHRDKFHRCLVFHPLGLDLITQELFYERAIVEVLRGVDAMHPAALYPDNDRLATSDSDEFAFIARKQFWNPLPRKFLKDRIMCSTSHYIFPHGIPLRFYGDLTNRRFRAPEIILGMEWDYKVGMWSMGEMVLSLFGFSPYDFRESDKEHWSDKKHLHRWNHIFGPPPKAMRLFRWNVLNTNISTGVWIATAKVWCLESKEFMGQRVKGCNKILFINMMRKIIRWLPEGRLDEAELMSDDFLSRRKCEGVEIKPIQFAGFVV
ncbi:hypothetical protein K470DRAFT_300022 [Piedraia hortae CBS 480.64]|uniref:Protein kinase domain-containing protein n=1 Tax=Piedraia hortae CBS 480.64 TaxID=1314780 RepID=A0A6A7BYT1_9PEZI|nr:hypothetical protein K470DRAFT_300022 [Piedraia hortae CBS 480.64]